MIEDFRLMIGKAWNCIILSGGFAKRRISPFIYFLIFIVAGSINVIASDFPEKPNPPRLVNDFGNFLSGGEIENLEKKLVAFNDSTTTQISIVTVTSLGGYDAADYAAQLGEKWGVGRKGKDNGVLILASKEDRDVYIATGYGMESFIPDVVAKRIVENYLVPNFKQGNFYGGFDKATDVIMQLATGQFTADDVNTDNGLPRPIIIFLVILFVFIMFNAIRKRNHNYTYTGKGLRGGGWGGPWIGGGGLGGGSWGSGGGGGGFGGFGGGGFGGGGAGGKW